jgi:hypothetical protein
MSNFRITGVRLEPSTDGRHEHISHVQIGGSAILRRQTVVDDLRSTGGDRYYTQVNGVTANVEVVRCPGCTFNDYLRTDRDSTTADNLLSLPRV